MFIAERTTYIAPIISPAALANSCPEVADRDVVDQHLLTVKAYNSPDLLERSLVSIAENTGNSVMAVVLDDSTEVGLRAANQRIAGELDAAYYPVSGEASVVDTFARYIDRTKQGSQREDLLRYLFRIVTDYPRDPSKKLGGVGGAQNVAHLVNVMHFGENQTPRPDWLATFIDHDVVLPTHAPEIFRLLSMYHCLGNVGIIASSYLHHAGSPTKLAAQAFEHLTKYEKDMSPEEVDAEMYNIFRRVPSLGLQSPTGAHRKYSIPEYTLDFPTGNYTLSGNKGFEVPVSIVGLEDRGFSAMLQLFIGARKLGVARVPGFLHIRDDLEGAANGVLADYFRMPKHRTHYEFIGRLAAYAAQSDLPQENIEGFTRSERARRIAHLARLRKLVSLTIDLGGRDKFAKHQASLQDLTQGVMQYATTIRNTNHAVPNPRLDSLISDMHRLHPALIQTAYDFGTKGELARYRRNSRLTS